MAEKLSQSVQPLVPERLFVAGEQSNQNPAAGGMLGLLASLLVAEKAGVVSGLESSDVTLRKQLAERMTVGASTSLEAREVEVVG